ncbi:MAG: delta-aminolevulinic acid dehydratase [Bacteroidia bacterium]
MSDLARSLKKLQDYIEKENYRGYDPYDGLKSPLFKLPVLSSNKLIRFGFQQLVKRSPFNLRPVFLVPKGYNPVTLGLCIQAYSRLASAFPEQKRNYQSKVDALINELEKLIPVGFSGACWGYDFDWAARYSNIPSYQPTVVATGIITNALFISHETFNNAKAKELCVSAAEFVLKDLNRTSDDDGSICFSYSPFDKQVVFNASMKGARLLSQVYSVTHNELLKQEAEKAVRFVMKHQRPDGAWIYSKSGTGEWVDNYHTGYIIDCLDEYIVRTGDASFNENRKRGMDYYVTNFFENQSIPKFYNKNMYPIDCTSAAQSLLTLSRFGYKKLAAAVADWMTDHMQSEKGYFYFRKFKHYTMKQSFMRWSNAWMFAGMSEVMYTLKPGTES